MVRSKTTPKKKTFDFRFPSVAQKRLCLGSLIKNRIRENGKHSELPNSSVTAQMQTTPITILEQLIIAELRGAPLLREIGNA